MNNPGLIKNFDAPSAIGVHRIATFNGADFSVQQGSTITQAIAGLTEHGSDNVGRCDVVMTQTGLVEFGGDVTAGDSLMSDANGKAVAFDKSVPIDDAAIWILGTALESGDDGTIGTTTINPFLIVK